MARRSTTVGLDVHKESLPPILQEMAQSIKIGGRCAPLGVTARTHREAGVEAGGGGRQAEGRRGAAEAETTVR